MRPFSHVAWSSEQVFVFVCGFKLAHNAQEVTWTACHAEQPSTLVLVSNVGSQATRRSEMHGLVQSFAFDSCEMMVALTFVVGVMTCFE
jgi:hypothetical protein